MRTGFLAPGSVSVLLEACVDSVESALAAQQGGAARIELCAGLIEGGTTPSAGMIALCRERLTVPVHVLIRPRGGDFLYDAGEVDVMLRDIGTARELGADGVVVGALQRDGAVDVPVTRALIAAARPLRVTFHRAFDVCRDPWDALETLIGLGVDIVLTSGQQASAAEGAHMIGDLVRRAAGRLVILAGGGIHEGNIAEVVRRTGVREVHVRGASAVASAMEHRNPALSFLKSLPADDAREVTDTARIRRMVELLGQTR